MTDAPDEFAPDLDADLDADEPEPEDDVDGTSDDAEVAEPPHPVNWNLLTAHEAEIEWLELNRWVHWLRHTYGLPASVIPPFWHHHPELLWELSALHLHWLCAYDPEQNGSAPHGWHRDFAEARERLREWVATAGTRLDRDRPTRQTTWPGEDPAPPVEDVVIEHREEEFVQFVLDDVARRREKEDAFYADFDPDTGEVQD
ncbi:hypothetical protein [Microbacterium lacticum]